MALSVERSERTPRDVRAEKNGHAWAESVQARLQSEGRRVAGGWPGTLSEARARVERLLDSTAKSCSPHERERLARVLYGAARAFWLDNRVAIDEE